MVPAMPNRKASAAVRTAIAIHVAHNLAGSQGVVAATHLRTIREDATAPDLIVDPK